MLIRCVRCKVKKEHTAFKPRGTKRSSICRDCSRTPAPDIPSLIPAQRRAERVLLENPPKSSRDAYWKRREQAPGSHTTEEWEAVKREWDYHCLSCGRREPVITLVRDHVVPITKGGSDSIDNIQPLCRDCNMLKRDAVVDLRGKGDEL